MSDAWHTKINWADTLIAYWIVLMMVVTPILMALGVWQIVEWIRG